MRVAALFLAAVLALSPGSTKRAAAAPRIPVSRDEVLARVEGIDLPLPGPLRDLRSRVREAPDDEATRVALVRGLLARASETRDDRLATQASGFLAPLLRLPRPPVEALVLEAVLLQRDHRFPEALARLDRALSIRPDLASARLVRAAVRQVTGRFREAAGDCLGAATGLGSLVGAACLGGSAPALGSTTSARDALEAALEREPAAPPGIRAWGLGILAELDLASGRPERAEAHLETALETSPEDHAALALWSDHLLDSARPEEVRRRLLPHARRVDLALRLARAELALGLEVARSRIEWVRRRLEGPGSAPGHERELAYLRLHLLGDPAGALVAALANFAAQREAIDARLVLEASRAAGAVGPPATGIDAWLAARRAADARFAAWTPPAGDPR